jgi:hypothetical protein
LPLGGQHPDEVAVADILLVQFLIGSASPADQVGQNCLEQFVTDFCG